MTAKPPTTLVKDEVAPVKLLEVDPDLGEYLSESRAQAARDELIAPVLTAAAGSWQGDDLDPDGFPGHFGLYVLDGVLARNVVVYERTCTELLGPGDILRPWVGSGPHASVEADGTWAVLERTSFAELDKRFVIAASRYPEVIAAIMDRLILRSRWLAFHLAVCHLPKVDDRLHLTFWHLADRWGRVTREGVEIQVKLSHRVLAAIVGARRPSVTTALGSLAERGLVERSSDRGWLLHGDQPAALQQMQDQLTADPSTELVGED